MKNPFKPGDIKIYTKVVTPEETATFDAGEVHPVYATFALGRDAEWACRLFVLEMKEDHEEGIGTFLYVDHHAPAVIGSEVVIESILESVEGNHVIAAYKAKVGERLIASGRTGQKIVRKEKLNQLFNTLSR